MASEESASVPAESLPGGGGGMKVLQFDVKLVGTNVWRKLQVPESYTFYGLHVAIQDSFGWLDYHLHEFKVKNPSNGKSFRAGIPTEDFEFDQTKLFASWKVPLSKYFKEGLTLSVNYEYDFGDDWNHVINFEGSFKAEAGKSYPICIDGKKAGPPEDCGGVYGFKELLKNLKKNPSRRNSDEKEKIEWLHVHMGKPNYDPDHFDPSEVFFCKPENRLRMAGHV